jgi:hypothetical protein
MVVVVAAAAKKIVPIRGILPLIAAAAANGPGAGPVEPVPAPGGWLEPTAEV